MFRTNLFTTLLLVISVAANPVLVNRSPVALPLSRRLNLTSVHNLVRHDQARAKALKSRGSVGAAGQNAAIINEPIDNQAVTYVAAVSVGSPATTFELLVDTGSSNTWVGAGTPYTKTSTSIQTNNKVAVTYGSGSFSGTEFIDRVALGSGLVIDNQSIGVASTSTGFEGFDGILGIGPVDLTLGTLSPATDTFIPTIVENLFTNGIVSISVIGVSFLPSITGHDHSGELTWGGTDISKVTGSITFSPLTNTAPASEFWGINQSIRYGASTTILTSTAGIVDTGTTLILLATNGFNKYKTATGGVIDNSTGLLRVSTTQFNNLQSLFFVVGSTFELTANAQIWPRNLNADIGGAAGSIFLIVADLGSNSGQGLDFINGYAFLERFYSVFDTTNRRVGFATTPFTKATTN